MKIQPRLPAAAMPSRLWTQLCLACDHMQKIVYLYGTTAFLIAVRVIVVKPKVLGSWGPLFVMWLNWIMSAVCSTGS